MMDFKHIGWHGNAEVTIKKDGETIAIFHTRGEVTGGTDCKTKVMQSYDSITMTKRVKVEIEV